MNASQQVGVVGFVVYAGGRRLNARPIPVRVSGRYTYRVTGPLRSTISIRALLAGGGQEKIAQR
jgi:hypothetical protein